MPASGNRPAAAVAPARQFSRKPIRVRALALTPSATNPRANGPASPRTNRFSAGTLASRCQQVRDLGRGATNPLERSPDDLGLRALELENLPVVVEYPT